MDNQTLIRRMPAALLTLSLLSACAGASSSLTPTSPPTAGVLVIYDWAGDYPPELLEAFTSEFGVTIDYRVYESQEEAVANIRAGQVYDVVLLENQLIPALVTDHLLAEIDYHNVPNFKNISPNFRDLAYDPGNRHSIPSTWGTTGLIVHSDGVQQPISRWDDLWDPAYRGRIVVWKLQRYLIGIALKSRGYSANSENPAELNEALQRLRELKTQAKILPYDAATSVEDVNREQADISLGWAGDVLRARADDNTITYVLPAEGTLLWGDNWVIPANSPHKASAEQFLNFLLRPEVGAQIVDYIFYATANEAARALISPDILNDPVIFPPAEVLQNAEIMLPLSPAGQQLSDQIWQQFLAIP
jgi:spermidine/putrescine transport system substrate-binding protein